MNQRYQAAQSDPDLNPMPRQRPKDLCGFRFRNPNGTNVDPRHFGIPHQDANGGRLVQTEPTTWERVYDQQHVNCVLNSTDTRISEIHGKPDSTEVTLHQLIFHLGQGSGIWSISPRSPFWFCRNWRSGKPSCW
jgi:hypothetical protein